MEVNNERKDFYNNAMRYGTLLGAVWAATYVLIFTGATNILCAMTAIVLYVNSPFIAGWLVVKYRKKECNDTISFAQAWGFATILYLCATILSTTVNFIYLNYIDQGAFLNEMLNMLTTLRNTPEANAEIISATDEYIKLLSNIDFRSFAWRAMESDFMNSLLFPPIIALFVKKEKRI